MANFTGGKIESIDYDLLALEVNRVYSDTSNGSGGPANLTYSTSDLVLSTTAPITGSNQVFSLTADITNTQLFIVVTVNSLTLKTSEYTVDTVANTVTITISIDAGAAVRVYNRARHIFGWGQTPASVYPHPTYPTDGIDISRVLEANINNLIDKVNISTARVGSDVELTRITKGDKIYPNFSKAKGDINTIASVLQGQVLTNQANWFNDIATTNESVINVSRTTAWENQLIAAFRWSFSTYNDARYFFNSGNELRCSVEMTGDPSDAGYANWSQVVNSMGSLIFGWNSTTQSGSGGVSESLGFYKLTEVYQTIFTSASPSMPYLGDGDTPGEYSNEYAVGGEYVNLVMTFEARYVENAGVHSVDIRVTMDDTAFVSQNIAGTTTFNAGYKLADDVVDNSATFTMSAPSIDIIDGPNSANDS